MADATGKFKIQICYATQDSQLVMDLLVSEQTTLYEAVQQSGILQHMPEIDLTCARVGIYGKLKTPDTLLREHDRIEIYRPLIADPKELRRTRARKKQHLHKDAVPI